MELDELIAFNDEIASLSRTGIPLREGLMHTASGMPTRLGQVAERVGNLMKQGQSLESVFESCPEDFPPHYRAVVRAGIRSGKLTTATESLATSLRRMSELRSIVANSMYYPIIVACCALLLFGFVIVRSLAALRDAVDAHRLENMKLATWWLDFATSLGGWGFVIPVFILGAAALWWWLSGRARLARMAPTSKRFAWVPGAVGLLRNCQQAMFTEVLSTLVQHQVPLDQSLVLAAEATDGRELCKDARELSEQIKKGDTSNWQSNRRYGIPPMVAWLVGNSSNQPHLSDSLKRLSTRYFRRAQRRSDWLRNTLPTFTTLAIAGTATLIYAGSFLFPWMSILSRLGTAAG
ncbi:MAG: type II secretion system F family protein [Planctomycetota bacterium]